MATVITSIGSKGTTGNPVNGALTIINQSGSGTPWTGDVTFAVLLRQILEISFILRMYIIHLLWAVDALVAALIIQSNL